MKLYSINHFLLLLGSLFFLFSCASKKKIIYLQGDVPLETHLKNFAPIIQPNDILAINVTAADNKASLVFNQTSAGSESFVPQTYTVTEDGTIDYPVLGKLKVAGLTRLELINLFKEKLDQYIVNPGVNISFVSFKVSVLGEVNSPGTFTVSNENITVLEAIAMAGDLTIQGKRTNIMLIREQNGKKEIHTLDLTDRNLLNSPVYYMVQNDVLYIEPNRTKVQSSISNYNFFITLASFMISTTLLTISLLK